MESYYKEKTDFHRKEWDLALEGNKTEAAKYHEALYTGFKAKLDKQREEQANGN